MTQTASSIDTGTTGAKRQSWRYANPRETLRRLIEDNPTAGKMDLFELFSNEVFRPSSKPLLLSIVEYWFDNNFQSLMPRQPRRIDPVLKEKTISEIKDKVTASIKIAANIMLLDLVQPNGKALRLCTGAECAATGGWLTQLSQMMPPDATVGATFTEKQVRAILKKGK